MIRSILLLLACSLILTSCAKPSLNYCLEGVQEFVIDSYQIRQGKVATLEMQGVELAEIPCDAMDEYIDFVFEDDILNIAVWHPTRRDLMDSIRQINDTIGFRVVDGYITIPDIDPIQVEGLTLDEAKDLLQEAYQQEIKDIELFISYKDRLSRKVDLTGLVGADQIPVNGKIRLYDILARAHIPPQANFYKSYVIRDECKLGIDLYRLMHEGDMSQNIVMRGGDKIFIADPMDSTVLIMGEVLMPKPVPLPHGFISLREAIVMAGGIPYTGNRNCIQVIRGNLVHPKIYQLSWEQIIHLPNDSLLLMPGDTVYVTETPITQWNRFISQLLPSIGGVQTATDAFRMMSF
ncbi:polysaccharide biosynthesis/export family protein [Chlamydiales bacterium]|nr:polysaccharide biosynthesis/export family protein [Chlamydiales bacterium]